MQTVLYSKLRKLGQEGLSLKVGWDNRRKVLCISKDIQHLNKRYLISSQVSKTTLSSHPFVEQRAASEGHLESLA